MSELPPPFPQQKIQGYTPRDSFQFKKKIVSKFYAPYFRIMDEFRFCCLAKYVPSCTPARDEFSSCEDLMSNLVLRICIWILGVVATVANLFVIILRTIHKNANRVRSWPLFCKTKESVTLDAGWSSDSKKLEPNLFIALKLDP